MLEKEIAEATVFLSTLSEKEILMLGLLAIPYSVCVELKFVELIVWLTISKFEEVGGSGGGVGDEPDGFLHATKEINKTKIKMHLITLSLFLTSLIVIRSHLKIKLQKSKGCTNDSLLKNIMHPFLLTRVINLQPVALQSIERHDFVCA